MLGATGAGAAGTAGAATAAPGVTAFVTPGVTQGGILAGGESATAGMASLDAIAASQPGYLANGAGLEAVAASQPGYVANGAALNGLKAGSALGSAAKGVSAYGSMNNAMGGNQAPPPGPAARPAFQGQRPPIAPQGPAPSNNNAVLAAIARRRQRGI